MSTLPTAREVNHLKNLIFENQAERWGVPMWMDAVPLLADLTSGASSIPAASFDGDTRRFGDVDYIVVWTDQFIYDFLPAVLNVDGSITLTGTTSQTHYKDQGYVIPVRIGRMPSELQFPKDAPYIGDLTVEFVLEAIDG
jgi:hypothetical protein